MGSIHPARMKLVEPYGVPEIYYTGVGAARLIGDGLIELVLYRIAALSGCDGPTERRIVGRIIRPTSTLPADMNLVRAAVDAKPNITRVS